MSTSRTTQSVGTLKVLRDQLDKLAGGTSEMGGFSTWFKSVRWDAAAGFNNEELAPLGWAIETTLFEYEAYPNEFDVDDLIRTINDVMLREGTSYPAPTFRPALLQVFHYQTGLQGQQSFLWPSPAPRIGGPSMSTRKVNYETLIAATGSILNPVVLATHANIHIHFRPTIWPTVLTPIDQAGQGMIPQIQWPTPDHPQLQNA